MQLRVCCHLHLQPPSPVSGSQIQNVFMGDSKACPVQGSLHSLMRIQPNYFKTLISFIASQVHGCSCKGHRPSLPVGRERSPKLGLCVLGLVLTLAGLPV